MTTTQDLLRKTCRHTETGLADAQAQAMLSSLDGWHIEGNKLAKTFAFGDYYETLAFVNAIAWMIHAEDHHPELTVTYNRCVVKFDTHTVNGGKGGLSENDFIAAAKTDAIFNKTWA